jgi:hypothetical protein
MKLKRETTEKILIKKIAFALVLLQLRSSESANRSPNGCAIIPDIAHEIMTQLVMLGFIRYPLIALDERAVRNELGLWSCLHV